MNLPMLLKKESQQLLFEYVKSGTLKPDVMVDILTAEKMPEFVNALSVFRNFDNDKIKDIWGYVINNVWKGCVTEDQVATVFNEKENIFFRELLNNKGVITKDHIIKKKILKNHQWCDKVAENLEDMQLIDILKVHNWKVIYVLNLKFYEEVFGR